MVKFFASGINFSCKVSPTILFRREISLSVKRTFLYIKIHFPRELLRKLPLLLLSSIPANHRVVKRVYRPFPNVAFNLFSPPAYSISKNQPILMQNRPHFPIQRLMFGYHRIFEMYILGIFVEFQYKNKQFV